MSRYENRDCGECEHFAYLDDGNGGIEAVCLIRKGKGPKSRMILECECQQPACSRFLLCDFARESEGLPSIAAMRAKREAAKQRKEEELAKLPPMFPQFNTKGDTQ